MVIWKGSKYSRQDKGGFRDRHSGIVYREVKKVGNRYVGIGRLGYEGKDKNFYGKDLRKIPARLKK